MALDWSGSASEGALAVCPPFLPPHSRDFPRKEPPGARPLPSPTSPPADPTGKALPEGDASETLPFWGPLFPQPCPALCLSQHGSDPKILPRRVPKAFGVGWGCFLGGRFLLSIPHGPNPGAQPSPFPPLQALPVGFHFWGYFGGFFILISTWPFKFSTPRSAFEGVFRFLYLLVLYGGKKNQKPTKNKPIQCSLYTVLGSFFRGEGDLSIETVLVLQSMTFFGFGSFSNDYFFIVVVKMSVAFQVSVSLAMK